MCNLQHLTKVKAIAVNFTLNSFFVLHINISVAQSVPLKTRLEAKQRTGHPRGLWDLIFHFVSCLNDF